MNPDRTITLAFVLFLVTAVVPAIPAYAISSVNVNPGGYQAPGTTLNVRFVVDFPKEGNVTFPQSGEMEMSTSLEGAYWEPVMVLDGMETRMDKKAGNMMTISGWYLSYPAYQDLQLRMTLTGRVPAYPSPSMDLLKVREIDADKRAVSSAQVAMPETPLVPPEMPVATTATATLPVKKTLTLRTFTPLPTDTPPESPSGAVTGIFAAAGAAALLAMRRT